MPPFIDFISLLLLNMMAGYFLLAGYVYSGLDDRDQKKWAPGFAVVGLVAFIFGAYMTMTWPVIGQYSSAFGEMSVLFGVVFLGAALALAQGWSLIIVAVYALFAGVAAMVLGVTIIHLKMTAQPILSGVGFILSGLGGVFAAPTLAWLRGNRSFRTLGAVVLVLAALCWAVTAYPAYYAHMKAFAGWVPLAARTPAP